VIDVDIEKEMAQTFEIRSVPTFILFDEGKEVNRIIGAQSRQALLEFIANE
jgi:thioredoxin 1